jgi:hypothetical protein
MKPCSGQNVGKQYDLYLPNYRVHQHWPLQKAKAYAYK